ncbi:MAG TPA: glycosyltransferase [Bacteroidales bacterium]|nr:glycosyltransferase [Bacteroidales bacterium]
MKIFVLLSRIPWPLEKGDKLRAYHQIRCLSRHHEIYLCALNTSSGVDQQKAFRALQPYCKSITFIRLRPHVMIWNIAKSIVSGKPIQVGYFFSQHACRRIHELINTHKPDMLYGQLLRVAEYLKDIPLPKAIDYQDVFSKGMARRAEVAQWPISMIFRLEYHRLMRYEKQVFDTFDLKTIISQPDRDLIPHPDNKQILVVPNGVDQDFFAPSEVSRQYDLVFTGNMAYPPNVNAAEFLALEIMPRVWAVRPTTTLLIAGATPDRKVKALKNNLIHVSGWLDDIRDAYRQSRVFIAPMRIGTGLQNKLLEAMSMGLPCITTPLAQQSLGGEPGKELLVAEHSEALADAVIKLLTQDELAKSVALAGRAFVSRHYHWESATDKLSEAMMAIQKPKTVKNNSL